ncbi:MAG: bifunctional 3-(3-hydroxy-phenyl)propionate/3-hydroxycinnamic acid hydroxylase [Pseudomonadales bacterium]
MSDYDVAIVGLGPVGCTAAILLAEAGLNVVAIERDEEVYKLPRAVNLDGEIIRAFQKVGRGQVVQDLMQAVRPGDRAGFANSQREWLFGQEFRNFGSNGWQPMNMFDQPELESYLREQAVGHGRVTAHIGYQAMAIENRAEDVAITFAALGSEHAQVVSAQYLVACDGASSATRKAFDIDWKDLGYDHDWLVVDVTLKEGNTLNNDTVQVCDPERILTYVCTKDPYRRWEFKMHPGETAEEMLEEDKILSLIDPWTPRGTYEIRRAAVYQFHAATADRWRVDRVFIAGDAAHQTPPFLGQGMNAGMRDVVNLAWKLPMVVQGVAKDQLLDTYFAERNAHAHDLVDWAVAIGQLMEHIAEEERCTRAGLPAPVTPSELKSSGYGQGREQPPIRDGVVILEQVSDSGSTGYLFNQPIVRSVGRTGVVDEFRFDELLGPGFAVVLRNGRDAESLLNDRSHAVLQRIGANVVSLDGLELIRGRFDRLFEQHEAAVVRPDRLVFGHTTSGVTLDDLIESLADKLALTDD